MQKAIASLLLVAIFAAGACSIVYGLVLWSKPLAYIVIGFFLVIYSVGGLNAKSDNSGGS